MVLHQSFSHRSRRLRAVALFGASGLLLSPFMMLAAADGVRDQVADLALTQPIAIMELAVLCCLAVVGVLVGSLRLLQPVVRTRTIRIGDGRAVVEDTLGHRQVSWEEPLGNFAGIRHRVLTTSEGVLHTLSLEHSSPSRSLVVASQRLIAPETVQQTAAHFGMPVLAQNTYAGSPMMRQIIGSATRAMRWQGRSGEPLGNT